MSRTAIEAAMTAKLASLNIETLKEVVSGLWFMNTPEAAVARGVAFQALEARIGEDAAETFCDGLVGA